MSFGLGDKRVNSSDLSLFHIHTPSFIDILLDAEPSANDAKRRQHVWAHLRSGGCPSESRKLLYSIGWIENFIIRERDGGT